MGGDRKGHMQVGLWILTGLLSFFIIQKIFPESDDDDKEETEDQVAIKFISSAKGFGQIMLQHLLLHLSKELDTLMMSCIAFQAVFSAQSMN